MSTNANTNEASVPSSHPTYGLIGFSRGNGTHNLFGSSVSCPTTIRVRIKRAKIEEDCNQEFFFGRETLMELELSPAQFAEAITCMNQNDGVPCTINYIKGDDKNDYRNCPYQPRYEMYEHNFQAKCETVNQSVIDMIRKVEEILSQSSVKKSDLKTVHGMLGRMYTELQSNLPFVQKCFDEYLTNSVAEAKQELDAFIQHRMTEMGIAATKEEIAQLSLNHDVQLTQTEE